MDNSEDLKLGDVVKFAKRSDGNQPYPNWTGKVVEIDKTDADIKVFRVRFDYDYSLSDDHPLYYITKGLWYVNEHLQVVNAETQVGFKK